MSEESTWCPEMEPGQGFKKDGGICSLRLLRGDQGQDCKWTAALGELKAIGNTDKSCCSGGVPLPAEESSGQKE